MAYNREWDRGKDSWNDPGSWNDHAGRGNIRGRDDDYYGEGKRRKYNNGGYDSSQGYDNSYYEHGHSSGRGRDWEHDDGQRRSGFTPKKRLVPSEASSHVIFLGLDPDFTEADLQAYLSSNSCTVEMVTIIRDRITGLSKGFGFAKFPSIEHARAFVDPNFPFVQVPPPASHGASAAAAFYKALETGAPHNGRRVKIDYSSSANPTDKRRHGSSNDGTRDIGNTQGPVLLFRGLDPLSGPGAIAQAMRTSAGPGKDGAKGMKRIILIRDKVTMASWGFAFVEFVDTTSASTVLGNTMSPQIHPNGFRISDRPVAASFAHPDSFQPLTEYAIRDEACLQSSTGLGGVEGTLVRYWDEASSVAVLEFKVEEPVQQPTVAPPPVKEKKEKKKPKGDAQLAQLGPIEASALPDKPVTLSFKGSLSTKLGSSSTAGTSSTKKPIQLALGFSAGDDDNNGNDGDGGDTGGVDPSKAMPVKKVAPMVASKKIVNNISKWNQVQEELRDGGATAPAVPAAIVGPVVTAKAATPEAKEKSSTPIPTEGEFEFSDTIALTCLLCARQFKSLDQLKRHNKDSDLHKKNYKDVNLRDAAREKAKAAKAKAQAQQQPEQPKYRDRASERRIMHNQPEAPLPELAANVGKSRKRVEGPPPPPSPPPPPVYPGADQSNVGNKLLKLMGWTEGTGLGTDGQGRVEPIPTAVYAAGVGLGASKGKDITKYTEGYSGYVHMAQDAARERYGS